MIERARGVLRVNSTDDLHKVKLNSVRLSNDYSITFPSVKISDEQLKAQPYFKYYRLSPVMELAYGPAALEFDKLIIEDGDYHQEVYLRAIPYLMSRVSGRIDCPSRVMWEMLRHYRQRGVGD